MKALVTGATGLIGSKLCRGLKNRGVEVRVLVLPEDDAGHIADFVSEMRTGDIMVPDSLKGICDGMDLVFHLAARVLDYGSKRQFYGPIVDGTRNMLEECSGKASRFVHVSSFAALGVHRDLKGLKEEAEPLKCGIPYGDSKADSEVLVRSYNDRFSRGCVIVRPSNVVGPGSVWVDELGRQFKKSLVPLVNKGLNSSSLIHVENLVDGMIRAGMVAAAAGQTYHLRDDWQVTWKQYMTDLSATLGKKPFGNLPLSLGWTLGSICEAVFTPLGLRPPVTRLAVGLMGRDNDVDTTKAQKELDWKTKISYEEALEEIRSWLSSTDL